MILFKFANSCFQNVLRAKRSASPVLGHFLTSLRAEFPALTGYRDSIPSFLTSNFTSIAFTNLSFCFFCNTVVSSKMGGSNFGISLWSLTKPHFMGRTMLRCSNQFKIFYSIIRSIFIQMVDMLRSKQSSAQMLLHDKTVLKDVAFSCIRMVRHENKFVAISNHVTTFVRRSFFSLLSFTNFSIPFRSSNNTGNTTEFSVRSVRGFKLFSACWVLADHIDNILDTIRARNLLVEV